MFNYSGVPNGSLVQATIDRLFRLRADRPREEPPSSAVATGLWYLVHPFFFFLKGGDDRTTLTRRPRFSNTPGLILHVVRWRGTNTGQHASKPPPPAHDPILFSSHEGNNIPSREVDAELTRCGSDKLQHDNTVLPPSVLIPSFMKNIFHLHARITAPAFQTPSPILSPHLTLNTSASR